MGFPLEPCCAGASPPAPATCQRPCGGVAGDNKEPAAAIGYRTPPRRQQGGAVVSGGGSGGEARVLQVCPPAPRKKRRPPPEAPAAGAQGTTTTEFYTGADLEAFFAAHNV